MDVALQLGLIILAVTAVGLLLPLVGLLVAGLAPRTEGWGIVRLLLGIGLFMTGAGLLGLVGLMLMPPANASLTVLVVGGPLGVLNFWAAWRCVVTREPESRPGASSL